MQEASNLVNMVVYSLPDDYYNTYIDELKRVSLEDLRKSAVENIYPDNIIFTVVGNRDKILNQLSDAGLGEVIEVDNLPRKFINHKRFVLRIDFYFRISCGTISEG
jgi:hypothetical protein